MMIVRFATTVPTLISTWNLGKSCDFKTVTRQIKVHQTGTL